MPSTVAMLHERGLINPPGFVVSNTMYETIMGSVAYGVSSDTSDIDLYGWAIPPKDVVFPHLRGEIFGFGRQVQRFEQYQQHHIAYPDALGGHGRTYDVTIYSIVKYFQLCMEGNPNMTDSLFVPHNCVLHCTPIGQMVRENRRLFLHKGCWPKFKGYAYSMVHKMSTKNPIGARRELIEQYGYDTKYAYNVVRLLCEVEQILAEGDLDLQRNREQLKAIRRGEWSEAKIVEYFTTKERELEALYTASTLPWGPDEGAIKQLLLDCLEAHYGSLSECVARPDREQVALRDIRAILDKAGY